MVMMDLRSEPWWPGCIAQVATMSLDRLAALYDVEVGTLAAALGAEGRGGPAHLALWWPLAVRLLAEGTSIRAVARLFGTEPRRVRRALARTGQRAAGAAFTPDGLPRLQPFVERLGHEPDGRIAKEAGVTPEAVQGERHRRGIPAFRQQPTRRPKLTQDDLRWIRGPKRNRREKFKPDAEVQVVRRPTRTDAAPPVMIRRPSGETGHFEASPRPEPRAESPELRPPGPIVETRRAVEPGRPDFLRPEVARPEAARMEAPRFDTRPTYRSEREQEIEALLNVQRRQRDGRQRIVRAEGQRPELPPEPERVVRPIRRPAQAPGWRPVDPAQSLDAVASAPRRELPGVIRRAEVEARGEPARSPSVPTRRFDAPSALGGSGAEPFGREERRVAPTSGLPALGERRAATTASLPGLAERRGPVSPALPMAADRRAAPSETPVTTAAGRSPIRPVEPVVTPREIPARAAPPAERAEPALPPAPALKSPVPDVAPPAPSPAPAATTEAVTEDTAPRRRTVRRPADGGAPLGAAASVVVPVSPPPARVEAAPVLAVVAPVVAPRKANGAVREAAAPPAPAPAAPVVVRTKPAAAPAPAAAPPVVVPAAPAPVRAPVVVAWYLEVPGWDEPLTYHAVDVAGVIQEASAYLDADLLALATIWRVGERRPGT